MNYQHILLEGVFILNSLFKRIFVDFIMYKPGTIRRISIKDFVTYSEVEMYPGPSLNIVIGPNGTGKSTIIAAIILGLGGTPKTIGRGSKISEYVRYECSEATITIELFDSNSDQTCTITRKFNLNNHNTWLINNKTVNEQEVKNTVAKYNIQVNNLCQFLPQDRVQDFAKLDKKELLLNTQKTIGRHDLIEKHSHLTQMKTEENMMSENMAELETKLNKTKEDTARLEGRVQNLQEKKKIKLQINNIRRKIAWENYDKLLTAKNVVEEDKQQAEKLVSRHTKRIQPAENNIKMMKNRITVTQKLVLESRNKLTNLGNKSKRFLEKSEDADNLHRDVIVEMRSKLQALPDFEREMDHMKAVIDKLKNDENSLLNQYGEEHLIDQKAEKLRKATSIYQTKCDEIQQLHMNAVAVLNRTENQIASLQEKLQAMENIKERRLQILLRRDKDAYEAVQWLRQNRDKFKGNVYEPVLMEVNVLDPNNAKYLENIVPFRDRVAFTCEYREDMNLFLRTLRDSLHLKVNVIHSGPEHPPLSAYKSGIPIERLRKFGFFSYMNSLISGPEPILKYLCKMFNLHNIPIGDRNTNALADNVPSEIRLFFSDTSRYAVMSSAYTGQKSTRISNVESDGTFSVSLDLNCMNQIRRQLEEFRENCEKSRTNIQDLQNQKQALQNKREDVMKERANILQQKEQIKGLRNKRIEENNKLERHMSNYRNAEQIKEEARTKIKDIIKNSTKIHKMLLASTIEFDVEIQREQVLNTELSLLHDQVSLLENEIEDLRENYRSSMETFNEINNMYIHAVREAQDALEAAKKLSEGFVPTDKGFNKFRERHDKLPKDLNELNSMMIELQTKNDCILTADDGELKQYEDGLKTISVCHEQLAALQLKLQKTRNKIEELHQQWIEPLQNVVQQINRNFGSYFESMHCSGEVFLSFEHPYDYASYGLSIRVTYRTAEPLQELNRYVQSGGERAVATAVFMLSIQDLTAAPFRCVDEINQGMDPQNERRILEILVHVTGRTATGQYFLITPKLIAGLKFGAGMRVHIVHNGPFCNIGEASSFRTC